MSRKDREQSHRKIVKEILEPTGKTGMTLHDLDTRLNLRLGRAQTRAALFIMQRNGEVRFEGARIFFTRTNHE